MPCRLCQPWYQRGLFAGLAWVMLTVTSGCGKTEVPAVKEPPRPRIRANADMPPTFEVSWKEQTTLKGHPEMLVAERFSADGKTLASQDASGLVKLWDVAKGKELLTLEKKKGEWIHGFAPNGRLLVSPGQQDSAFSFRDPANDRERDVLRTVNISGALTQGLSADCRKYLEVGKDQKSLSVLDITTGVRKSVPTFGGRVHKTLFSPGGKDFVTLIRLDLYQHGEAKIWNLDTLEPRSSISLSNMPFALAESGDGGILAIGLSSGSTFTVEFFSTETGKEVFSLEEDHRREVLSVAFAPDGKTVATGGGERMVKLWDVSSGKKLRELPLASNGDVSARVVALAYSPDGRILAAADTGMIITLWEVDKALPATAGSATK